MKITLNNLPLSEKGKIIRLDINNNLKRRLLDLGLIYNTEIKCLYKSTFNDPKAYLVRGSVIALRDEDANKIYIDYIKDGENYGTN